MIHYAHSLADKPLELWHELGQHLEDTAARAEEFAAPFAPGWARLAGLWHDAGKYQLAFQKRIGVDPDAHTNERVPHSGVGALIAVEQKAQPLALVIAGHHGGLKNFQDVKARLQSEDDRLAQARRDGLPKSLESQVLPPPPAWIGSDVRKLALWTRLLFSALVDADFLDTEKFYKQSERDVPQPVLASLLEKLEQHLDELSSGAEPSTVNKMRARVLDACRMAATNAPGAFTLTVPTGGGKTLSALAFALRHAVAHRLRRVIVVIPFTSILEQTAKVYRGILGQDSVVEHHSNIDPDHENRLSRIASENWDAPIVVTTSVQFFESLYANRTSRCRKLHRVVRSVVVFDEVQTFPVHLLEPIRDVLENLVADYGVTAVFCTATQPALRVTSPREIVEDVASQFAVVANRCEIRIPVDSTPVTWESIALHIKTHEQVLAIVHRRADAETLARLAGDDCIHLSARMCAAHRSAVLTEIKQRLCMKHPCRVVSTQLVEAGVDIDFPDVYRAFAGADSMAQAAGRCNREGRLSAGRLHIFFAPSEPPRGILRVAKKTAEMMWKEGALDLTRPQTFQRYFERLYSLADLDAKGVLAAERDLRFEDVASLFRMIEETGEAVVAPYGDAGQRVREIRRVGISRFGLRRLQPFIVNLYPQEIRQLEQAGAIEPLDERLWTVVNGFDHVYDVERFGFGWKGPIAAEPAELIA